MTIAPIVPTARREPFDGPEWTFELKFDGFRAIADTVNGRMLSKRGNRMHRFEALLGTLPADCVFDGEVVALDAAGRPMFADLMFGRRPPVFLAFDVLVDRGAPCRSQSYRGEVASSFMASPVPERPGLMAATFGVCRSSSLPNQLRPRREPRS